MAQATRQSSQVALNAIGPSLGELVGGSADLTGSNNTFRKDSKAVTPTDASGNYINYGVREFGMTAIMNGLSLHGGFRPYAGTFLMFSDYARNAVRMAALMHQGVILVYTHDSIGLGEDGPTHQPIEHVSSLRLIPNLALWRPCDALETAVAWVVAVERRTGPTALVLTRQALPQQPRTREQGMNIARGGYVLIEPRRRARGHRHRHRFGGWHRRRRRQGAQCRGPARAAGVHAQHRPVRRAGCRRTASPCCPAVVTRRVAIEAGATALWWKYVGSAGRVLGIDRFGASGKAPDLFKHFGLTAERRAAGRARIPQFGWLS